MDIQFLLALLGVSLALQSWYCYLLAKEKGKQAWIYALFGVIPLLNCAVLVMLYRLPDKPRVARQNECPSMQRRWRVRRL